ncbi:hypothetical protein ACG83_04160 [Frankia sp. R43]|uniref:hypothetical protein n=1 Tax=Frankia sp. R43 TaxID=269536 RepID=UPI0006CA2484|nr:hypothetical protein [Frankia sp. R43]KPM57011.1 hypothetical protein ACG83_04160 [Frankia sp. R43]
MGQLRLAGVSSVYVGDVPWSVGSEDLEDRCEPVGSGDLDFGDQGFDESLASEVVACLDDRFDVPGDCAKGGAGRHDGFVVDLFGEFGLPLTELLLLGA